MKTCDICGTKNLIVNNYCIHCGNKMEVSKILDNNSLFTEENLIAILNYDLSKKKYNRLLDITFEGLKYIDLNNKTTKEKILEIAKVFGTPKLKSSGYVKGENKYDIISYDDRLSESEQIATIIHETAHCIIFNFFVTLFCDMLQIGYSKLVRHFIHLCLSGSIILGEYVVLLNEFYAHTVENRFIPFEHQNYGSYNNIINNSTEDFSFIEENNENNLPYSLAQDVINKLDSYMDENLRNDIKNQFKKDFIEKKTIYAFYDNLEYLDFDKKVNPLYTFLLICFKTVFENSLQ